MSEPQIYSALPAELRNKMAKTRSLAVLAGAGLSTASGLRPFRGENAMDYFAGYHPPYLCSLEALEQRPELAWRFYKELFDIAANAQPNEGHKMLAAWQQEVARKRVVKFYLITTNFDGLIARTGGEAKELHGNISEAVCSGCHQVYSMSRLDLATLPPYCSCGKLLKPDITLLNDYVKEDAYKVVTDATRGCEIFLAIGCSGVQNHSLNFVRALREDRKGVLMIEVNPRPSYLSKYMDIILRGRAEEVLPQFEYHLPKSILD
jgi:NAD-dependent deacetylase